MGNSLQAGTDAVIELHKKINAPDSDGLLQYDFRVGQRGLCACH